VHSWLQLVLGSISDPLGASGGSAVLGAGHGSGGSWAHMAKLLLVLCPGFLLDE